mgnify:FL=1
MMCTYYCTFKRWGAHYDPVRGYRVSALDRAVAWLLGSWWWADDRKAIRHHRWLAPRIRVQGEAVSASKWNAGMRDSLTYLRGSE